jgi:hypothetical protein
MKEEEEAEAVLYTSQGATAVTCYDTRTSFVTDSNRDVGERARTPRVPQCPSFTCPVARAYIALAGMYTSLQAPPAAAIGRSSLPEELIDGILLAVRPFPWHSRHLPTS